VQAGAQGVSMGTNGDTISASVTISWTVPAPPPPPVANLGISLGASPNTVKNGATLTYTIALHNSGPDAASSVVVTDTLPNQVQVVSATQSGSAASCNVPARGTTGGVSCTWSSLASGASWTLTIVTKVQSTSHKPSTFTDTASVSSSTADPTSADNSASTVTKVQ
jgi:uncharacterized repeat protein (TIGR01451 family)